MKKNTQHLSEYDTWEREITDLIIEKLECPNGGAQGIVEAQPFYMDQCWSKGMNATNTANFIIQKSQVNT